MKNYYGVLVVYTHDPRQDSGVPAIWDGWFSDRGTAMEVLRLFEDRHPRAEVHLIERLSMLARGAPTKDHYQRGSKAVRSVLRPILDIPAQRKKGA